MKTVLFVVLFSFTALLSGHVLAHGEAKAKHGGVVAKASDLEFELVASPEGAVIYVEDHGKALKTTGVSGKLTVLNGAAKVDAQLKSGGDNRLVASGVKLSAGSKAVAVLTFADQKAVTVRFAVK